MKILDLVNDTAKKHSEKPIQIFRDFIEMTYQMIVTAQHYIVIEQSFPRYDKEKKMFYEEVVNKKIFTQSPSYDLKYKHLAFEHYQFTELLEKIIHEKPFTDVIEEPLSELISLDTRTSDLMIPAHISSFLVKLLNEKPCEDNCEHVRVLEDLRCGTGKSSLSAFKEALKTNETKIDIIINDVDDLMVKISLIQVLLNNVIYNKDKEVNITAYCHNTLTDYQSNVLFAPDIYDIRDKFVIDYIESKSIFDLLSKGNKLFENAA